MHLSDDFFSKLNAKLSGFKKQYSEVQMKKMEKRGARKVPCPICGAIYEAWNGFKQSHRQCEKCRKHLEEGFTCVMSLDNRFAFVKFPAATPEQAAAVAGKTFTIPGTMMDIVNKPKSATPENN